MSQRPRISVIIPVYNHAAELVACLRSLEKQTHSAFEIIVVDDGSIDRPKEAVENAGLLPRVTSWIASEANAGAPKARNAGFAVSSGAYVIFLDADATLKADALEKLLGALQDHPEAAFSYSAFRFGRKVFLSRAFSAEALADGNYIHTSGLIRRSAFPGFDVSLKKFQDWDLWLQIVQAGGVGAYVPELLFEIAERKQYGMSQWIPSFAYGLPWQWFGREPEAVTKYRDAKEVIVRKHAAWIEAVRARALKPTLSFKGWVALAAGLAVLSALTLGTVWSGIGAVALALVVGYFGYRKPEFGLALLGFELMLGSKGGWLKLGADGVNDGGIGIRILVFAAFFAGFFIWTAQRQIWLKLVPWAKERWLRPYWALAIVVAWGVVRGLMLKQPFLVPDANAWGFLLALVPMAILLKERPQELASEFKAMLPAGLGLLIAFTIGLFLIFSQTAWLPSVTDAAYAWVRRAGLGEITHAKANIYRVFLASQIMLIPAWLRRYQRATTDLRPFTGRVWATWVLIGIALIICLSRSLWLGTVLGAGTIALQALLVKPKDGRARQAKRIFLRPILVLTGSIACVALVYSAPVVTSRFTTTEAAAASRWNLLPIMWKGVQRHQILGSGFGATLTYETKDPRIVEKTGGVYTTYAFEWGWLDLWYKLGVFGVLAVLWVLASIIWRAARSRDPSWGFVAGTVVALATVHVFTPYLNHPLGIGLVFFLEARVRAAEGPAEKARALV